MSPKVLKPALAAFLLAALGSCKSTSSSFVADCKGFAVVRGRVVHVDRIAADQFQQLSDGVVLTVSQPGSVTLQFEKKNEKVFDVDPGSLVVFGKDEDFVLRKAER